MRCPSSTAGGRQRLVPPALPLAAALAPPPPPLLLAPTSLPALLWFPKALQFGRLRGIVICAAPSSPCSPGAPACHSPLPSWPPSLCLPRLEFDDLHSSGIYTWPYLRELGQHKLSRMRGYIRALRERGLSRDPPRLRARRGPGAAGQQQQQQQQQGQQQGGQRGEQRSGGSPGVVGGSGSSSGGGAAGGSGPVGGGSAPPT